MKSVNTNRKPSRVIKSIPILESKEISSDTINHYIVEFLAPFGIGLKLTLTKENELLVSGFNPIDNSDRMGPAEACGSIRVGDILAGVNHLILYELGPMKFADAVSQYDHDKTVSTSACEPSIMALQSLSSYQCFG